MKKWTFLILFLVFITELSAQESYKAAIENYRNNYLQKFLRPSNGPLDSNEVKEIRFFKIKKKYKLEAAFSRIKAKGSIDIPTSDGGFQSFIPYGKINFLWKGQDQELTLFRNLNQSRLPQYRNYLLLLFKDQSNGKHTYSGGRYIDLSISDIKEGRLSIDFNKAYNPLCVYSEKYSCPIPPVENHLQINIKAGEKNFQ